MFPDRMPTNPSQGNLRPKPPESEICTQCTHNKSGKKSTMKRTRFRLHVYAPLHCQIGEPKWKGLPYGSKNEQ